MSALKLQQIIRLNQGNQCDEAMWLLEEMRQLLHVTSVHIHHRNLSLECHFDSSPDERRIQDREETNDDDQLNKAEVPRNSLERGQNVKVDL